MTAIEVTWPSDENGAVQDQLAARSGLTLQRLDLTAVRTVMAVGVGFSERRKSAVAVGVPMLLNGDRANEATFTVEVASPFPYVPGLFFYREGPAVVALLNSLPGTPDLLVTYGQGIAHPRGFGLASHIGVLARTPTIGLTRKRLWGRGPHPPAASIAAVRLRDGRGTPVGIARRMLETCEPIYASPGHLTDIASVERYLDNTSVIRGCMPAALSMAQEEANHRAFQRKQNMR